MSIIAKSVSKTIGSPPNRVLTDISLDIGEGEFVALTGRSGSGKSTLLYLLSSLDSASSGSIEIDGRDIRRFGDEEINRFRNEKVGFVFQFHYLISELTALENILLPALRLGKGGERKSYAEFLLNEFGLGGKGMRLPRQLSGGEQQRVAIARALVMDPKYIFADEPTGALDSANGEHVMKIIQDINEKRGATVVMVTHDPDFAARARRQIHLVDGRVVSA
jgi:putative ABC transport system ATP-binding protein/lipoprotein-releasing system ATP-binding protein